VKGLEQNTNLIKAEDSWRSDYWFSDQGIYRIAFRTNLFVFLIPIATFVVLRYLVLLGPQTSWIVFPFFGIMVVGWFVLPYYILMSSTNKKRKSIGPNSSVDDMATRMGCTKISWEDVKGVNLVRRRTIRIFVGVRAYKAQVKREDYDALKDFLKIKLGDRLRIREGNF
jgi:hypothetical protein